MECWSAEALVEIVGEFQRVTLGVGGGEFAVGISRAGNDAAAQV